MLTNTANYRIGKSYKLEVYSIPKNVVVVGKGYKKLQLKLSDNTTQWFNTDDLSAIKSKAKIVESPKTEHLVKISVEKTSPAIPVIAPKINLPSVPVVKVVAKSPVVVIKKPTTKISYEDKLNGFKPHAPIYFKNRWVDYWEYQQYFLVTNIRKILADKGYNINIKADELLAVINKYLPEK